MPKESSVIFKKKVQPKNTPQQKLAYEERQSGNPDLKKMSTNDTFFGVGEFDKTGIASFDIPEEAGKIWVLRIHIHAASETWVLIQNVSYALFVIRTTFMYVAIVTFASNAFHINIFKTVTISLQQQQQQQCK